MNARSVVVIVLLPAACLGFSTFDSWFEHWYAAAGRDGFTSMAIGVLWTTSIIITGVFVSTIRQGFKLATTKSASSLPTV